MESGFKAINASRLSPLMYTSGAKNSRSPSSNLPMPFTSRKLQIKKGSYFTSKPARSAGIYPN
jgi:hypothetical protein